MLVFIRDILCVIHLNIIVKDIFVQEYPRIFTLMLDYMNEQSTYVLNISIDIDFCYKTDHKRRTLCLENKNVFCI